MQTHIVPVGFDYDRLIAPLIRDQVDVDKVILLEGAIGSESNVEYSQNISEELEKDFQNLLGADAERVIVNDVYDYDQAFEQAYELINTELDSSDNSEVWVNVSAMPRPVSFAYATAAHSIMVERQEDRNQIHTYYTAPEKYLETELAEELRAAKQLLYTLLGDSSVDQKDIERRYNAAQTLLKEFDERGTTIGAKCIDGSHMIELPVASFRSVKPFEEIILFELGEYGEFDSVSELAETLATDMNEEYTDSFRSKVIYNVDRLGPGGKGYIEQEDRGKSYRTRLSHIGQLWVRAHTRDDADVRLNE
ncbi:MAG: hypothetical protein J07HQX50_02515 [Haloquadratum sp. J07HQX50]|nr:MAG: hypothetical protein J07HQX50_02515 [Haloquadratum sp. J07HQX50]